MNIYATLVGAVLLTGVTVAVVHSGDEGESIHKLAADLAAVVIAGDKKGFAKCAGSIDSIVALYEDVVQRARTDKRYSSRLPELERKLAALKQTSGQEGAEDEGPATHQRGGLSRDGVLAMLERSHDSFDKLLANAKQDGVDLSAARYAGVVRLKAVEDMGYHIYVLNFSVVVNDVEYEIRADDVVETPSGYLIENIIWRGKRRIKSGFL